MIKFTIPGKPEPQLRPRATRAGRGIRMYDPPKTKRYKEYVSLIARKHAPAKLLEGELAMSIIIYRHIPKSTTKTKRKKMITGDIRPIVKPDNTNYAKGIEDALNGIIYKDDSHIVDLKISKYYSDEPRVEIYVEELKGK